MLVFAFCAVGCNRSSTAPTVASAESRQDTPPKTQTAPPAESTEPPEPPQSNTHTAASVELPAPPQKPPAPENKELIAADNSNSSAIDDVDSLFQEAIDRGKSLVRRYPELPDARELLARIYWITGQFTTAESIWHDIVHQTPGYAYAHHGLGQAAAKRGDFLSAAEHHARAASLQPNYEEAALLQAASLTKVGKADEAIGVLTDFLSRTGSASAQLKLGQAYLATKQFSAAEQSFQQVLAQAPDNLEALSGITVAQSRTGKKDQALESRERLAELRRKNRVKTMKTRKSTSDFDLQREALASRLFSIGQVYYSKQQWKDAEDSWKRAYELDESDRAPLEQLAALYIGLGNAPNALVACAKLYRADQQNAQYAFNYAMVLDRTGNPAKAIEVINLTAKQSPSPQVLGMLADLQYRQGNIAAAEKAVEQALQLAPENVQLKSLLATIESAKQAK
jgi:tetratricopeptide (TPR) repeat protein